MLVCRQSYPVLDTPRIPASSTSIGSSRVDWTRNRVCTIPCICRGKGSTGAAEPTAPVLFFFGCRNQDNDFLYKDFWLTHAQDEGVLSSKKGGGLFVAFPGISLKRSMCNIR